jgi:hypothetical protein
LHRIRFISEGCFTGSGSFLKVISQDQVLLLSLDHRILFVFERSTRLGSFLEVVTKVQIHSYNLWHRIRFLYKGCPTGLGSFLDVVPTVSGIFVYLILSFVFS